MLIYSQFEKQFFMHRYSKDENTWINYLLYLFLKLLELRVFLFFYETLLPFWRIQLLFKSSQLCPWWHQIYTNDLSLNSEYEREFEFFLSINIRQLFSVQFNSVAQSCPTLCDPMNCSTPGLPVHHQLPEFTQIHIHRVSDAIQPSHPLSSPSPPAPNPSQHQSLSQWVNSSHEVAKVLEFQL